jgi:hypothetical protein
MAERSFRGHSGRTVVVIGAFGNVGTSTVAALRSRGHLADLRRRYEWRRPLARAVAPLIRAAMLRKSPYWRIRRRTVEAALATRGPVRL